jgi:murein L,D-transpeptidase YafK
LRPLIGRYADKGQIDRWRSWVAETVRESRERGGYAIIVSKVDRSLTLYKNGKPQGSFRVGLGFNGAREKLHAGDRATPEGRYRIVGKIPKSRYHKALLINYPNEEDRRQFAAAKEKGLIPDGVGIGGLIEIHGGGTEGMTYGYVALANREIDALYRTVEVGTPVTIVGTMDYENDLSTAMKGL